jgi:hypothetical protein
MYSFYAKFRACTLGLPSITLECMVFKPFTDALSREQQAILAAVSLDDRMDYEELAAHFEYNCGELRAHAERHAFSMLRWQRKWELSNGYAYPDFRR